MAEEESKYDDILWTITKQAGGVPEFLSVIANFLRRRTDFFSGASEKQWENLLMKMFHEEHAKALRKKGTKEIEEIDAEGNDDDEQLQEAVETNNDVPIVSYESVLSQPSNKESTTTPNEIVEELSKPIETAAADETVADDVGKLIPNAGNGCTLPNYSWTQSLKEIELKIPLNVTQPVRSRDVNVNMTKKSLTVGIKGQMPTIDGDLSEEIKPTESTWMLQDGKIVFITLEKRKNNNWWERLIMTDPVIAVRKIVPESSKLSDLDDGTRVTVEKMLYNQRQKQLGLPTSEDQEKMKILEEFKMTHAELDFSKCKY